jgi:hypothetical protein
MVENMLVIRAFFEIGYGVLLRNVVADATSIDTAPRNIARASPRFIFDFLDLLCLGACP